MTTEEFNRKYETEIKILRKIYGDDALSYNFVNDKEANIMRYVIRYNLNAEKVRDLYDNHYGWCLYTTYERILMVVRARNEYLKSLDDECCDLNEANRYLTMKLYYGLN